jgi:TRAP-type C4-dicarboxylate transport system permease small subunit
MIERLERAARLVETLLGWAVGALVVVVLAIVALQLVDRHFFDVGMQAPDQLVRIGLVWLCFLGFAAAVQAGANVRIDFIDHWVGAGVRRALAVLFDATMLALCVLLAVKGWRVVEVGAGQQLLGTPFTAALPNAGYLVGIVLLALFLALRLVRTVFGRAAPPAQRHDG